MDLLANLLCQYAFLGKLYETPQLSGTQFLYTDTNFTRKPIPSNPIVLIIMVRRETETVSVYLVLSLYPHRDLYPTIHFEYINPSPAVRLIQQVPQ